MPHNSAPHPDALEARRPNFDHRGRARVGEDVTASNHR